MDYSTKNFEAIIIGGSYSGLSAAMSLGRALRRVLVIDGGRPCNRTAPHSHNFLTQDGQAPGLIAEIGREQVAVYPTVEFCNGLAVRAEKNEAGFEVAVGNGELFYARKLIIATGLKDELPEIPGFSACWGKSVIHCPYCHGYEVKHQQTGILANGDGAFHYAQLIDNWTKNLTLFTNGPSTLSGEQATVLQHRGIGIVERNIGSLEHENGQLTGIIDEAGIHYPLHALYARPNTAQHSLIPEDLGCALSENGLIVVDSWQKTTIPGVFACGDNSSPARAVSVSVATGTMAGAFANHELVAEAFKN